MWTYETDYLMHYGILGQKWGIRRYQNEDGTLTAAGKKRAAKLENEYKKVTGKNLVSDDELRERTNRAKLETDYTKALSAQKDAEKAASERDRKPTRKERQVEKSNAELQAKIDRLKLENQLSEAQATYDKYHPTPKSKGQKFIEAVKNSPITKTAGGILKKQVDHLVDRYMEEKIEPLLGIPPSRKKRIETLTDDIKLLELNSSLSKLQSNTYVKNQETREQVQNAVQKAVLSELKKENMTPDALAKLVEALNKTK